MQFRHRFSRLMPSSLFDLLFPFPEHMSYTMPSKLSRIRLLVLLVSSRIIGRWFSISAFASNATSVVLKSPIYADSSGFAQIDAATIRDTVLPPSVSPQRSTINGSPPRRLTRTLAKDAAIINFISSRPDLRSFCIWLCQIFQFPRSDTLS